MREYRAVYLPQIPRQKRVFGDELRLLELAIDERDIPVLVELGTAELELVLRRRLEDSAGAQTGIRVVQEALERWEIVLFQRPIGRLSSVGGCLGRSQATPEAFTEGCDGCEVACGWMMWRSGDLCDAAHSRVGATLLAQEGGVGSEVWAAMAERDLRF